MIINVKNFICTIVIIYCGYFVVAHTERISITWSNRLGSCITPITTDIWAAERTFTWNSIDVGGRSVIARVNDGSFLVHSPVGLTSELEKELKELGDVSNVLIPNYEHLKYSKQWKEKYNHANFYTCPDLHKYDESYAGWTEELTIEKDIVRDGSLEFVHFDCEINPFTGKPFFNELVFYHVKSKSLFMADVFWVSFFSLCIIFAVYVTTTITIICIYIELPQN